jgi:hypothetical protein
MLELSEPGNTVCKPSDLANTARKVEPVEMAVNSN